MKILAIDYGLKRVGIAVSFADLAQPLLILENNPTLLQRLGELIATHQVKKIVVGVSEGEMAKLSLEFAQKLRNKFSLPVILVDETLSSYYVHQALKKLPAKKRRGRIDHYAAALILQNYLDDHC